MLLWGPNADSRGDHTILSCYVWFVEQNKYDTFSVAAMSPVNRLSFKQSSGSFHRHSKNPKRDDLGRSKLWTAIITHLKYDVRCNHNTRRQDFSASQTSKRRIAWSHERQIRGKVSILICETCTMAGQSFPVCHCGPCIVCLALPPLPLRLNLPRRWRDSPSSPHSARLFISRSFLRSF